MDKFAVLVEGLEISLAGNKLNIEGTDYTLREFRAGLFDFIDSSLPEAIELLVMEKKDSSKFNTITKDLFEAIKRELRPTMETGLAGDFGLENLTPVVDMESDEVLLVDEANNTISEVKYKPWLKAIDKEYRKTVEGTPMPIAKFYFDPYNPDIKITRKTIDSGVRDMVYINTYIKPLWWQKDTNDVVEMPPVLSDFLNHLLKGDKSQIEYCVRWLAEAVFGRNETYLVLNGDKGVGKNTLYELMKAIISPMYAVTAPQSLTTSHFNSVLENKRLILLDEYKINRTNHLFLKKVINKNQTIEKKGVDANTEIETFNSFMIFHNDVSDMYLEKDDRRFSVLDITSKNLTLLWDAQYIHDLMVELNDPGSKIVAEIGGYLNHVFNTTSFNNTVPYKGEKFHEIVEYHMPTWLQIVISMIENGEVKNGEISFKKDIEKKLSNEMMGKKKIQWRKSTLIRVLKEYKYKDSWSLGDIEISEKRGSPLILRVNPELLEHFEYDEDVEVEDIL